MNTEILFVIVHNFLVSQALQFSANVIQTGVNNVFAGEYFKLWINTYYTQKYFQQLDDVCEIS